MLPAAMASVMEKRSDINYYQLSKLACQAHLWQDGTGQLTDFG
jgi:hypothetical protein